MTADLMRTPCPCVLAAALTALVGPWAPAARAQEPPPPIPRVAIDLRGTLPRFTVEPQLAESQNVLPEELPLLGLGGDGNLNVYLFKWKAVTVGIGGQVTFARGTVAPKGMTSSGQPTLRGVTEWFQAGTGQLSFNFGDGEGWSYISGGLGVAQRSLVPDGEDVTETDEERLRSVNYGGGARWFIKSHLAFTFDVRFHQIDPGTPRNGLPGTPRSTFFFVGAGISIK